MFYASNGAIQRSRQLKSTVTIHAKPVCSANPHVPLYQIDPSQHNISKCPHCFKVRPADVKLLAETTLRSHDAVCECDACDLSRRILL